MCETLQQIRQDFERRRIAEQARRARSVRELADRVAGSSEETAALFDSGYRTVSELGQASHEDRG
jgi:hypothetical protein